MKILTFIVALFVATSASAQTHPCDLPVQTGTQSVVVNAPFTLSWCHDGKDASGAIVNITGWQLVRGTEVPVIVTPTVTPTANVAGLKGYSIARSEPVAGSITYNIFAVSGTNAGARAAITFTVTAVAPGPLAAPTNVRVVP